MLLGTASWDRIVAAVEAAETEERVAVYSQSRRVEPAGLPRERTPDYMAYVKVAEGCSNGCTFCLIPYVRGGFRSRTRNRYCGKCVPWRRKEYGNQSHRPGYDEYGRDLDEPTTLTALLQRLPRWRGSSGYGCCTCIRSIYGRIAGGSRSQSEKYASISTFRCSTSATRSCVHRRDRAADIRALLRKIRAQDTYITLRTTLLSAFPADGRRFPRPLRPGAGDPLRVGVFRYSREEGTPAARLPEQIPEEIKEERYHTLMAVQAQISEEINRECVGRRETARRWWKPLRRTVRTVWRSVGSGHRLRKWTDSCTLKTARNCRSVHSCRWKSRRGMRMILSRNLAGGVLMTAQEQIWRPVVRSRRRNPARAV